MRHLRLPLIIAASLALAGGLATMFLFALWGGHGHIPLEDAGGTHAAAPLPKDAIVLTASEGAEVVAPFLLHDEAGAVGGSAAFLAKGSRTEEHTGRVKFSAKTDTAATYTAWLHARWRDTCSNSCALKVGGGTEILVGNDDVFNVWHWVPAGKHKFEPGENPVALIEREDGVYIDQLLFTRDAAYVPSGAITTAGVLRDVRRFADTFTRSPGHGNEGWDFGGKAKWEIAFSFDPNRIPNQYALSGDATAGEGTALVKGAPWYGCRTSFDLLPGTDGSYGCIAGRSESDDNLAVIFLLKDGHGSVRVSSAGKGSAAVDLGAALRLNQWHRVVVERWAWITRVLLDGNEVLRDDSILPKPGPAGLFVHSGKAVFDDFEIEEIPWIADNGADLRIQWTLLDNAQWFRDGGARRALSGQSGSIKAGIGGIPLEEVVIDERASADAKDSADFAPSLFSAPGLQEVPDPAAPHVRTFRLPQDAEGSSTHATFTARTAHDGFRSVALRFGRRVPATFNMGPYTFTTYEIDDPSDYLDFTEEEYKAMAQSTEAQKLRRHAKTKPIVGPGGGEDESPWIYQGGYWRVNAQGGYLAAKGANALLRHAQEISSDMEMRLKVRLGDVNSIGEVELYNGPQGGVRVQFSARKIDALAPAAPVAMQLPLAADHNWHELTLRVEGSKLSAKLDREPIRETEIQRGSGDRVFLKVVKGALDFDDIEFVAQRQTSRGVFYGFNQPEPDWWREPADKWIDHGGIACVLASSWISLVSPRERAALWNKRSFASDLAVSFNIEENTEWYGWDKWPNHVHFPCENICAILAPKNDFDSGYRLEVNAERHTHTILFRDGKEVARVRQDGNFPIRFVGSHMPFLPRVHRITLSKNGGELSAIVNGMEVLHWVDPQPLAVARVGLGGHDTRLNFSHVEIRVIEPQTAPPPAPKHLSSAASAPAQVQQ